MPGFGLPTVVNMDIDSASEQRPVDKDLYLVSEQDIIFEQEILRNPASVEPWLQYITYKQHHGNLLEQSFVFERACTAFPRSYKIWKMYLEFRIKHVLAKNPAKFDRQYWRVNALFERALVLLNKMPRIWEMYLTFLIKQPLVTATRRTFDRALRSLPITQHNRIWAIYREFARSVTGQSALKVWARYMQVHPEDVEEYIDVLVDMGKFTEAVQEYIGILNNPRFKSKAAKGPFEFYTDMLELLIDHARMIRTGDETGIDVEQVVRAGLERFQDQQGELWAGLARYWIGLRNIDKARDTFEEGITSVKTIRDFTFVFDTYAEAEESSLAVLEGKAKVRIQKGIEDANADDEFTLRLDRLDQLLHRRSFLLNDVNLRINPNNVIEWQKRVGLWGDNQKQVVQTYTDAIATIQPRKAYGNFHDLWTKYAKFYEAGGDMDSARMIMEKAVKVHFKSVNELAEMYCEWAEMELRNEEFERAMAVMKKATDAPRRSKVDYFDESLTPQQRIHKSWKVWSFYVDLTESVRSIAETRAVYDRIFQLRIATPQTVVNYANLLEENHYFEDAYRVYERGLDLFSYPVAFEIWNLYLSKALERKMDIERMRDLFEQALQDCPARFAKPLYYMYGALEEERGISRFAMRIYERATRAVPEEEAADVYNFYITKAASNHGIEFTRPIYEEAVMALPDDAAKVMSIKFAQMEMRLGEIDRARGIYAHASQFADPRRDPAFWAKWESFEVQHGNEDTFKEMLRIKRSVQTSFNTDVGFLATQAVNATSATKAAAPADANGADDAMAALERQTRAPTGFVAASSGPQGGNMPQPAARDANPAPVANPDAIDLDDD